MDINMHVSKEENIIKSTLYIVPTPIGNMKDITQRALFVLENVDYIAVENIRRTSILMKYFFIKKKLIVLNINNEKRKTQIIIKKLLKKNSIALVSNAGTPLINDPGYELVYFCHKYNIRVIPLPGPCAAIAALSASGLSTNRFCYEGFLPKKKKRISYLQSLTYETRTIILYESPKRILESLHDMMNIWGTNRYIVIAKEISKIWEKIYGSPIDKLLIWIKKEKICLLGEITLIIEGYRKTENIFLSEALKTLILLKSEIPLEKAMKLAAKIHKVKKNVLYNNYIVNYKNFNSKE